MSRRAKQMLAAAARQAADEQSFVPVLLLSELDVTKCSQAEFVQILTYFDEIIASCPSDQKSTHIEQVYHRMLQLLSQKVALPSDKSTRVINQFNVYHPEMAILTLDDLKKFNIQMEKRAVIIHVDLSASMDVAGFNPLVKTIIDLGTKLQNRGTQVHVYLFGDRKQEAIHVNFGGRLLTLNEFANGNYRPDGAFQDQCRTVFFVAPPWSPLGVEEKHAKAIASSVHANVPYIGIASEKYPQLATIVEEFLNEQQFFARLLGYTTIGGYTIPSNLLAPTRMLETFNCCYEQGEKQMQVLIKKILGLFRYLEETAKLNFERCIRGDEFRNLMSLVTPLIKISQSHLETNSACQQLYGYLTKILDNFGQEYQKLIKNVAYDPKVKAELQKFWDDAMSFSERAMIIDDNERKYGKSVAFFNVRITSLTCTSEMLSEALQQLKTLYSPEDADRLSLILDILSVSR
ncbi:unnamed protein product, partial [Rotaria sordida]